MHKYQPRVHVVRKRDHTASVIDLHSKNEPWDLHFSKALFKGLYSDGPYMYREEFAFPNQIARSKFIVFALFYLVFECKFSKYKLLGGLYLER